MDPAFIGNALLLLGLLVAQTGGLSGLFSDSALITSLTDDPPDDAYDEALYAALNRGTDLRDVLDADDFGPNQAYILGGGNDILSASDEDDYAQGGAGDDYIVLYPGDDVALGGEGDDVLLGGVGDDNLRGGSGNDRIDGSQDDDQLSGGDGNDTITGGVGSDVIDGGAGDDTISGDRLDRLGDVGRGIDVIDGGAGDDTLTATGADTVTGGTGEDSFRMIDSSDGANLMTITDYAPADDQLIVVYEAVDGTPPPGVTVSTPPGTADALIEVDGIALATITGASGLTASDIALVGE